MRNYLHDTKKKLKGTFTRRRKQADPSSLSPNPTPRSPLTNLQPNTTSTQDLVAGQHDRPEPSSSLTDSIPKTPLITVERSTDEAGGLGDDPHRQENSSAAIRPQLRPILCDFQILSRRTFQYFYDSNNNQFQAKVKSEGTRGAEDSFGYLVWPVSTILHAAAECDLPLRQVRQAISVHQEYWNPELHAFCSWKTSSGNNDISYEYNAYAALAFIAAYGATGDRTLLTQATNILKLFIIPSAQLNGQFSGIPRDISNDKIRSASSTGAAIVAALKIAAFKLDEETDTLLENFGLQGLRWLQDNLLEGFLISNQVLYKDDGLKEIDHTKWAHNCGFFIHGLILKYKVTRDGMILAHVRSLGLQLIDYPSKVSHGGFSDGSFFLHHLVDAYIAIAETCGNVAPIITKEVIRIADWAKEYVLDSVDGLYYSGSVPRTLFSEYLRNHHPRTVWKESLKFNLHERDEHGNLCKTLIGCAGWIKILRLAAAIRYVESLGERNRLRGVI